MGKKHTGPKGCKCGDPKCKDPKCKKHKREVGTGHGAEQNDAGEVGWSGSGSPYPKKKGYSDEVKEVDTEDFKAADWDQQSNEKRAKPKKKKKKKSVITNVLSRLKSLDFLLRDAPKDIAQPTQSGNVPKKDSWIAGIGAKDISIVSRIREPRGQSHGSQSTRARRRTPMDLRDSQEIADPRKEGRDPKSHRRKKAVITNVHSRLKNIQSRIEISDFLLRSEKKKPTSGTRDESIGEKLPKRHSENYDQGPKEPRRKKRDDGESSTPLVKDGEFGGMNTGQVEWTEPRDTANSRTKRDKDVA
jgi:hypothetical protein